MTPLEADQAALLQNVQMVADAITKQSLANSSEQDPFELGRLAQAARTLKDAAVQVLIVAAHFCDCPVAQDSLNRAQAETDAILGLPERKGGGK